MLAYLALIIAIVGLVLFLASGNVKVQEIGRILFFSGVLTTTLELGGHAVRLF